MRSRLLFKAIMGGFALCLLPACATVDMSGIASPEMAAPAAPDKSNAVVLAVQNLQAKFKDNGWIDDSAQHTGAAAMRFFGFPVDEAAPQKVAHTAPKHVKGEDLRIATGLILAVIDTAETVLDKSGDQASLDDELAVLEAALSSAKQAQTRLLAGAAFPGTSEAEALKIAISSLYTVTNAYGDHVRAAIAAKSQDMAG